MKAGILLAGILLPALSYCQQQDTTLRNKLLSTAPRLGGITITNQVVPVNVNGQSFTMQLPVMDVSIPLYKKLKSAHPVIIKAGIRYQGLLLSNEKAISSNNFHSLTIPLLFSYSLSRATNLSLIGTATLSTDFISAVSNEDMMYMAGFRLGFRQNKLFKYGVTITYIHNFAGQYLLPLPDFDWSIGKRLNFSGILPARTTFKYKFTPTTSLGITASLGGGSMYRLFQPGNAQYIHLRQSSAGIIYDQQIAKRWKLNLVAGRTLSQRLETFNMDQKISLNKFNELDKRVPNISYQQNSFLFQGSISYQF
ncbi:hypothetical protein HNQ91_000738 [Filimonas zeae]|uniref:DUF6268 domain-containing protein n=1 Tax=Filimonas zeae TaxID=1737353 RepID=A0A917IQY9_9BACT|nr:DUF6268 family outer membrane beta-barrel protein [Filimonas zeae]MDR6337716.1 hypothetical protein [Filimonas zeae]GGH59919.1 hypothetical protein GCM10011379_07230 [Filimonas zeae]